MISSLFGRTRKTAAPSTHGAVTGYLICKVLKNDIKLMDEIGYGSNTAVTLLEFDDDNKASMVYYNDASHFTDELKNPKATIPAK